MLLKIVKASAFVALAACTLSANSFNAQAEKDKTELIKYFEAKFADPEKNAATFFPYSTEDELKNNIKKDIKHMDFGIGNYAFNRAGIATYEEIKEMPPYEDAIDAGAALYEKKFANGNSLAICFPDPTIGGDYPMFDESRKEVVSLTQAVNECITSNGEKKWNEKKGDMAKFQAFIANSTKEAEKKVNVKIESAEAAAAYERGKEFYYTQRGYLNLSCATCHVQGAAQRVRNESLSQLLGHTTHFPVYRLKWQGLGTLERRMEGCVKDQGQNPPKPSSKTMKELLYFMAYMSNGMAVDGPDIRK
ncbi:MAG: sulfur oxidation c-type cytochrome SoxA [Arcobacteraceae bacterium]|nr:sulfur oxidation c-type cytochrome SoxA [Arcobacteraceae bacterium]